MRVHELAKQVDVPSKDLVVQLKDMGIEVKSHMSSVNEEQAREVLERFSAAPAAGAVAADIPVEPAPEAKAQPAPAAVATAAEEPPPAPETVAPETDDAAAEPDEPDADDHTLTIKGPVVVREFAEMLGMKPNQVIAELMSMNVFASISERVEVRIAQQLARKHGFVLEQEKRKAERRPPPVKKEEPPEPEDDQPEQLQMRPPIVTFLGHVDHGKTSLLDRIRQSKVAPGEHGGITQHVGAYTVSYKDQSITFLDTPGHAAFTAMRARGANLTDIAVIVIAADDGIMPQTREAIQHARAAGVAIIVALNKIDLPRADQDRAKQQLQQEDLATEDWGGETICCPVSAMTGEGVNELLEMILLQAEVLELTANPTRRATGYVIESKLEPGMGPTANLLVRRGTLCVGDAIVCGPYWGRIKALISDDNKKVRAAGPSVPVKCMGLTNVPEAGAKFEVVANAKKAKEISDQRLEEARSKAQAPRARRVTLDDLLASSTADVVKELALVIKADVQGSLEALDQALKEIKSDKIQPKVVLAGVGNITVNDVLLASASNAIILGFHVPMETGTASLAKREGVEIRLYNVIYELVDDVRDAMTGRLAPEERERVLGQAQIRQVFELSNRSRVAGCMITKGRVHSRARARIIRSNDVIFEGRLQNLKRFQNDANEVREGQECGIRLDNFKDYQVGDTIETYEIEKLAAQL